MNEPLRLSRDLALLLRRARTAARRAYAPYSKFNVGAAVRTTRGAIFTGVNVENASYGLTICAERNAIAAAVAGEGAKMRLAAIAVFVTAGDGGFPPCGACRQVIAEFATPETVAVFGGADGEPVVTGASDLLPHAFRL
jgi:cytidine deaminase